MAKKQTKKPLPKLVQKAIPGVKVITLKRVQKDVALKDIIINDQARTEFDSDAIIELAKSIKDNGLLQPIGIHLSKGKYYLIYGERRTRAMKLNKAAIINAMVYENLTADQICELQITENLQRKDLNPIEEANAFKKLMVENKKTVSEIALRLSRSEKYIATRLKLADLIPEFQKALFQDRMTMKDALECCKYSKEMQKEIFIEDGDAKDSFNIADYTFNQYKGDLKTAPFDLKDATLIKAAGACNVCPHNTAGNQLFYDEKGKSICMNNKCFESKCDKDFENKLKKAIEDPASILYTSNHYDGNITKELKKEGNLIYNGNKISIITSPKDSEIKSGKIVKAFCVEGDGKGKEFHVKIIKESGSSTDASIGTAGAFKEKQSEGKTTDADILSEIARMESVEKRKKEIDEENTWNSIYSLLEENKAFNSNMKELSINEKITLIIVLFKSNILIDDDEFLKLWGCKINMPDEMELMEWLIINIGKLDGIINNLMRQFFYAKISSNGRFAENGDKASLMNVIGEYDHNALTEIQNGIKEARSKREEKLKLATDKLRMQLTKKAK